MIFTQVRDTVVEELSASDKAKGRAKRQGSRPVIKGKYSRLEADISSMQRDSATYCDEPADTADYQAWRSNFNLDSYKPAVQELIADTAFMAELQARIVPVIVEYDAFWTRYFYRLHLLEVYFDPTACSHMPSKSPSRLTACCSVVSKACYQ